MRAVVISTRALGFFALCVAGPIGSTGVLQHTGDAKHGHRPESPRGDQYWEAGPKHIKGLSTIRLPGSTGPAQQAGNLAGDPTGSTVIAAFKVFGRETGRDCGAGSRCF